MGKTLLLCSVLSLLLALPAAAQSPEEKGREARTACLGGDYARGAMLLSELFVTTRDATYIYNQGRCFEQNARYQEAISRFQEYLRVAKDAGQAERAEAEKHIADCRAQLAPPSPAPVVTAAPPRREPAPLPVAPATLSQPIVAEPKTVPGAGLRTAGLIVGAAGVAGLAAGIVLNLKVNAMASDYEKFNGYTDKTESERRDYETWGWVGYGVGAACIGTGAILYYLGVRAGRGGALAATLVPASGGGAFVLRGAL